MPQLSVYDSAGQKIGEIEADERIFGAPMNKDLLHQAILVIDSQWMRKAGRAKTRGEVDMTTAKMYRQKGLGRARHGSRSAPLFVGGGVAHPPRGNRRVLRMPKKARRKALFVALSDKARRHRVLVLQELAFSAPRTKQMLELLHALRVQGKILLLGSREEVTQEANAKSARNVPQLILRESPHLNARDALWADYVIFTQAGLELLYALAQGGDGDGDI